MSVASEWVLAVHRFIWYPLLYAMGLERDAIDVPIGGWRSAVAAIPAQTPVPRKLASSTRIKRKRAT